MSPMISTSISAIRYLPNSELIVARPSATTLEEVKRYTIADSATWAHPAYAGRTIAVKDVDKLIVWGF